MEAPGVYDFIYRYLQEEAPVLFLIMGLDGQIRETNPFTQQTLGATAGRTFQQIFVDFHNLLEIDRLCADPSVVHMLNVSTAGGLPKTFYCRFIEYGDCVFVLGRTNAQEQDQFQRDFLALNAEINNLTRQLHKTNAELVKLNQLKNQFLGMAAHDLRNPLQVIMSYVELLQARAAPMLDAKSVAHLDKINHAAESMQRLIEQFLDVSIIESGRLSLERKPTDLGLLLGEVLMMLELRAGAKQIELAVAHDPAIPPLEIDGPKIGQVIKNLVANAIEHSHRGTRVSLCTRLGEGVVEVAVHDQGVGIAAEEVKRLFMAFEKISAKKTAGERSHGLGLAIAKKIVETHQGRIWVESRQGEGSSFIFTLPLAAPPAA